METLWTVALSLCAAVILSIGFNPILIEISNRRDWYAKTNHRTIHTGKIPYIGGIAIFYSFVVAVVVAQLVAPELRAQFKEFRLAFLLFGLAFFSIHILGLIDDFVNVLARYKLIVQIAAAATLSFSGYTLEGIRLFDDIAISFGAFSHVVTIFWFVGISNAVNLVDGMDGLSGISSAVAALFFGVTFLILGNIHSAVMAFALLGAIVGFLLFNWPKAQIFMGDSGALFLGFALAAIPFFEHSGVVRIEHLLIPLSLLFFPVMDTFMAIGRRIRRRKPLHSPDKEHIHHKLLDLGFTQNRILIMLMGVFLIPAATSLALLWIDFPEGAISVGSGWLLAILFFVAISRRHRHRVTGHGSHSSE